MVWNFRFPGGKHLVQLGSHFTCICYRSLGCERLLTIADRILVERPTTKAQLIDASSLELSCPICLETERFQHRGFYWCFCRQCLKPFHKECLQNNLAQGVNQLCPNCRCPILNMTATFNSSTTKQSAPDSLKTILDKEEEDSLESVPERISKSNNQENNFLVLFGSDEEDYSDEGEDISADPFWKPLLEVAAKHGPPFGALD